MASDHRQRRHEIDNSTAQQQQQQTVDERIWKACAGSLVKIPPLNSIAYYFPQGHVEQSSPLIPLSSLSPHVKSQPLIPCRVQHVSFLADGETDEVYATIRLIPLLEGSRRSVEVDDVEEIGDVEEEDDDVVSFAKVLTPSDANNGGGFSVPRFCADAIFPPLDFEKDPPVQNIQIKDIHGQTFDFRHIYRGTPRRHLLTTGWSKFVNSKKLVAGDSVVFIRDKSSNELFVGVRRVVKPVVAVNEAVMSAWGPPLGFVRSSGGGGGGGGRGREVVEAVEKAVRGGVFEVVYYPKGGVLEFVVAAERVERALRVYWREGMRVKLATETEDSSRVQWFQGVVVAVLVPESGVFRGSSWRMLEVKWDEPEILKNMNKVNPWQVEYIPPTPPLHATFPPTKKLKYSTNSLLFDGEEDFPLPSVGFSSMMSQLSSSYLNHNTFPAGMQGARQNNLLVSSLLNTNTNTDGTRLMHPEYHGDRLDSIPQEANHVSTNLNVGKTSSDTPSPDSQNSVQLFGTAGINRTSCGFTKKAGITSFQLFGKTIYMEQQPRNTEYDGSENEGAGTAMDHQLVDSYKKLHDKLGDQCKISPVVGGFVNG